MSKEKYIDYTNNTFNGKAKEIVLNQIELFYDESQIINKNHYKVGEDVILKKGTFMHGIPDEDDFCYWEKQNKK